MPPPTATLGGVTLTNAQAVEWTQTTGVAAPLRTFIIHESQWSKMEALLGKPVALVINSSTAPNLRWDGLYPLREIPTSKPYLRAVVVSDIRYWIEREIIVRTMNIPRKTGDKRIVGSGPVEIKQSLDIYQYASASLDGSGGSLVKWVPRRAIESILGELASKVGFDFEIKGMPIKDERGLTVEGVDLAESGASALNRILALLPHAMFTVDSEGKAVVFDGTNRTVTEQVMDGAGVPTVAGQIDRLVDLSAIRPSAIHVYFAKEVELRFDSILEADVGTSSSVAPGDPSESDMQMENVLPLPDPETMIDGEIAAQGTWVPVHKAIAAWNDDLSSLGKPISPPALTLANIRKHWFWLDTLYTPMGNLTLSASKASWTARLSAIKQHFRRTFQIPHPWMQHIRDLRPIRVGILDAVTGARAPSQAWSQYCIEPTTKAYQIAALQKNADLQFAWLNVDDYPGFDGDLFDKRASPAVVEVRDRDLGILHINYQGDPYDMRKQIHPSLMKENGTGKLQAPTRDLRDQLKGVIESDGHVRGAVPIGLADDFRVAVVITAMPFAPNDEGRYLKYTVKPSEIQPFLSEHFDVGGGQGRPWHIAVPPPLLTAWYALVSTVDGRDGAKGLFGFDVSDSGFVGGPGGGPGVAGPPEKLPPGEGFEVGEGDLIVTAGFAPGYKIMNFEDLIPAMARAVAVTQWAQFVSQREGARAVHLQPGIEMGGSIESVTHSLGPDGRLITTISMPSHRRPISATALLAPTLRPMILGQISD